MRGREDLKHLNCIDLEKDFKFLSQCKHININKLQTILKQLTKNLTHCKQRFDQLKQFWDTYVSKVDMAIEEKQRHNRSRSSQMLATTPTKSSSLFIGIA